MICMQQKMQLILQPNSWLIYDFQDIKICPTNYTIQTFNDQNSSPSSWIIDGSNTGNDNDWSILDVQSETKFFLLLIPTLHTFTICDSPESNSYYRYLRLKTTDPNNSNSYFLAMQALEFYGSIIPKI